MANFDEFVTSDGLIDGAKVTKATKNVPGVIRPGNGLFVAGGVLYMNIADVIDEIAIISETDIDSIVV